MKKAILISLVVLLGLISVWLFSFSKTNDLKERHEKYSKFDDYIQPLFLELNLKSEDVSDKIFPASEIEKHYIETGSQDKYVLMDSLFSVSEFYIKKTKTDSKNSSIELIWMGSDNEIDSLVQPIRVDDVNSFNYLFHSGDYIFSGLYFTKDEMESNEIKDSLDVIPPPSPVNR